MARISNGRFISKYDAVPPSDIVQNYLIKGWDLVELPEKYVIDDHAMSIEIEFYAAINNNDKYPLSQALITKIKPACCTSEEDSAAHSKKLREYGIYSWTIGKFVNLKKIKFDFESMDSWILIKDLETEDE